MCLGSGGNGKSVHLDIIQAFLGVDNCESITLEDIERDDYSIGLLQGKLANIAGDISNTPIKDSGKYKTLTGGDLITANRKHLSHLKFTNYAKLVFSANELPPTYDMTDGFMRRWVILKFPYTYYKEKEYEQLSKKEKKTARKADPQLIDKLTTKEELQGLLNWALDGLQDLMEARGFTQTNTIKETRSTWQRESNSFYAFFEEELVVDKNHCIIKDDIRRAYAAYCRMHKVGGVSDKVIKMTFERQGINDKQVRVDASEFTDWNDRVRIWSGIRFKHGVVVDLKHQFSSPDMNYFEPDEDGDESDDTGGVDEGDDGGGPDDDEGGSGVMENNTKNSSSSSKSSNNSVTRLSQRHRGSRIGQNEIPRDTLPKSPQDDVTRASSPVTEGFEKSDLDALDDFDLAKNSRNPKKRIDYQKVIKEAIDVLSQESKELPTFADIMKTINTQLKQQEHPLLSEDRMEILLSKMEYEGIIFQPKPDRYKKW